MSFQAEIYSENQYYQAYHRIQSAQSVKGIDKGDLWIFSNAVYGNQGVAASLFAVYYYALLNINAQPFFVAAYNHNFSRQHSQNRMRTEGIKFLLKYYKKDRDIKAALGFYQYKGVGIKQDKLAGLRHILSSQRWDVLAQLGVNSQATAQLVYALDTKKNRFKQINLSCLQSLLADLGYLPAGTMLGEGEEAEVKSEDGEVNLVNDKSLVREVFLSVVKSIEGLSNKPSLDQLCTLGVSYFLGLHGENPLPGKAVAYLRRAKTISMAHYYLYLAHRDGRGAAQDIQLACKHLDTYYHLSLKTESDKRLYRQEIKVLDGKIQSQENKAAQAGAQALFISCEQAQFLLQLNDPKDCQMVREYLHRIIDKKNHLDTLRAHFLLAQAVQNGGVFDKNEGEALEVLTKHCNAIINSPQASEDQRIRAALLLRSYDPKESSEYLALLLGERLPKDGVELQALLFSFNNKQLSAVQSCEVWKNIAMQLEVYSSVHYKAHDVNDVMKVLIALFENKSDLLDQCADNILQNLLRCQSYLEPAIRQSVKKHAETLLALQPENQKIQFLKQILAKPVVQDEFEAGDTASSFLMFDHGNLDEDLQRQARELLKRAKKAVETNAWFTTRGKIEGELKQVRHQLESLNANTDVVDYSLALLDTQNTLKNISNKTLLHIIHTKKAPWAMVCLADREMQAGRYHSRVTTKDQFSALELLYFAKCEVENRRSQGQKSLVSLQAIYEKFNTYAEKYGNGFKARHGKPFRAPFATFMYTLMHDPKSKDLFQQSGGFTGVNGEGYYGSSELYATHKLKGMAAHLVMHLPSPDQKIFLARLESAGLDFKFSAWDQVKQSVKTSIRLKKTEEEAKAEEAEPVLMTTAGQMQALAAPLAPFKRPPAQNPAYEEKRAQPEVEVAHRRAYPDLSLAPPESALPSRVIERGQVVPAVLVDEGIQDVEQPGLEHSALDPEEFVPELECEEGREVVASMAPMSPEKPAEAKGPEIKVELEVSLVEKKPSKVVSLLAKSQGEFHEKVAVSNSHQNGSKKPKKATKQEGVKAIVFC